MDAARDRLAAQMNERRVDLLLKWSEVASRAGLDSSYLRRIRKGEVPISDLAARQIEDALEWKPGSVKTILDEGQPTPIEPASPLPLSPFQSAALAEYDALIADDVPHERAIKMVMEHAQAVLARLDRTAQRRRNTG